MVATFKTDLKNRVRGQCVEMLQDVDFSREQSQMIVTAIVMMIEAYKGNDPMTPVPASVALHTRDIVEDRLSNGYPYSA